MSKITDLAYAAGFFDGEGCIQIQPNYTKGRHEIMSVRIVIAQNDPAPLHWIAGKFGGRVTRPASWVCWRWDASAAVAMKFLHLVRPFLIVKAKQADLAFAFEKTLYRHRPGRRGLSAQTIATRNSLFLKMKAAKTVFGSRGPIHVD